MAAHPFERPPSRPSLPSPRQLISSLVTALSTSNATHINNQPTTHPLRDATANQRSALLTLHVLFPNELLPALDLLDRRLVTRLHLIPPSANSPPSHATHPHHEASHQSDHHPYDLQHHHQHDKEHLLPRLLPPDPQRPNHAPHAPPPQAQAQTRAQGPQIPSRHRSHGPVEQLQALHHSHRVTGLSDGAGDANDAVDAYVGSAKLAVGAAYRAPGRAQSDGRGADARVRVPCLRGTNGNADASGPGPAVSAVHAERHVPQGAGIVDVAQRSSSSPGHVYSVRSAHQASSSSSSSRYRNAAAGATTCYEVRLEAWTCSCPAFAFSAFPVSNTNTNANTTSASASIISPRTAKTSAYITTTTAEETYLPQTTSKNDPCIPFFGGTLTQGADLPVCKHLLACVLAEHSNAFSSFVEEKGVSCEEMAGWAAGWGD